MKFFYDLSSLRRSPYFEDAMDHIRKDLPDDISHEALEKAAQKLNNKVERLRRDVHRKIRSEFGKIADVSDDFPIKQGSILILRILENRWSAVLYRHTTSNKSLNLILSELEPLKDVFKPDYSQEKDTLSFNESDCAIVSSKQADRVIRTIERLTKDKCILESQYITDNMSPDRL